MYINTFQTWLAHFNSSAVLLISVIVFVHCNCDVRYLLLSSLVRAHSKSPFSLRINLLKFPYDNTPKAAQTLVCKTT